MKGSRFNEEQIIAILREQEAGAKTVDVCRKHGISSATFYKWKSKYGGLEVSDARRLKVLEDENRNLWREVGHNPIEFLKRVSVEQLERRSTEMALDSRIDSWLDLMARDPGETWTEQTKLYERHLWKGPAPTARGRSPAEGRGRRTEKRKRQRGERDETRKPLHS